MMHARGPFTITCDPNAVDLAAVHAFLSRATP